MLVLPRLDYTNIQVYVYANAHVRAHYRATHAHTCMTITCTQARIYCIYIPVYVRTRTCYIFICTSYIVQTCITKTTSYTPFLYTVATSARGEAELPVHCTMGSCGVRCTNRYDVHRTRTRYKVGRYDVRCTQVHRTMYYVHVQVWEAIPTVHSTSHCTMRCRSSLV